MAASLRAARLLGRQASLAIGLRKHLHIAREGLALSLRRAAPDEPMESLGHLLLALCEAGERQEARALLPELEGIGDPPRLPRGDMYLTVLVYPT